MNCINCNENKEQREFWKKVNYTCPCCFGSGKITFHRSIQWRVADVLLLDDSGKNDASVQEMENRCLSIIKNCYTRRGGKPFDYSRLLKLPDYITTPEGVRDFYINHFRDNK